jgi:pimeloyl-ACP methyl ester carboxylesterase
MEAAMAISTAHSATADIAFETFGPADGRPLLLVMGLDSPMQWWPDGFCAELASRGFQVARFDGRDCGKSTRYTRQRGQDEGLGQVKRRFQGIRRRIMPGLGAARKAWPPAAYTANDMVGDGLAVLDSLGWESAHIVGASLGAGLALGTAIQYPERVRTVVSMMGLPTGFRPADAARYLSLPGFLRFARSGARTTHTLWEDMNAQVETARMLASPNHPFDAQWAFATAAACRTEAPGDPATGLRQLAAMRSDEGLLHRAAEITAPLLVLHGADDPLIKPAAATALTRQVPGAKCVIYADMGHEVPRHLWAEIADEIGRHADSVDQVEHAGQSDHMNHTVRLSHTNHTNHANHLSHANGQTAATSTGLNPDLLPEPAAAKPSSRTSATYSRHREQPPDLISRPAPPSSHPSGRVPD